jgi:hypothetical protein
MSIGLADIFASVRLNLETGKFETDALKSADLVAGKMGNVLKKAMTGALGAGAGMAFASMTRGALELDRATAEFTAQTGASAAAAREFKDTLADLNKTNVQNITEIGATLTALKQHFNLSGEAAKEAAAAFLDFSRVAGTDAATAAGNFDELVDSGVISIGQMAGYMDVLTVSHQKFGVNIADTVAALVKFAPAMTAFGISTEEATGYINLFSEMGLNAEVSTKAFNLALQKVKSPDELKRLISEITATEDPFLRAQLASDLFGKRAGVQLANALKPGSGGIAAWTVTMEEAAGATERAGDALDESFTGKAALAIKAVTGSMAELGDQFGELLIAAAVLGPTIVGLGSTLVGALVGAVGGVPLIIAGFGVGFALAVNQLFELAGAGAREGFRYGFQTGDVTGPARTFGPMANALVPEAKAAFVPVGVAAAGGLTDGLTIAAPSFNAAAHGFAMAGGAATAAGFAAGARPLVQVTHELGFQSAVEFGAGAESALSTIVSTGKQLMEAFAHPLNVARLKTKLAGALHAKALVDGLNAGDPAVRGAAHAQAIAILTYLDALKGPAYVAGRNAALATAKGFREVAAKQGDIFKGTNLKNMAGDIESIYPSYESQVAKLAISPGTIQGNKALADVIKELGGAAETAGNKAASGADKAKAKAKQLADAYKDKLTSALDKAKDKAKKFFDDLHEKNVKAIQDTRDLANAQLDAQIGAINAEVQAARDEIERVRDARRLAELQAAVANAETDEQRASAQTALDDWLADQRIQQMERDAKAKIDVLELQKKANDDLAAEQVKAEDARYAAQTAAFDKEIKALEAHLAKHPVAWKVANDAILKVLADSGVGYAAAGAKIIATFVSGLQSGLAGIAGAATLPALSATSGTLQAAAAAPAALGAAGTLNVGTINISGASGDPKIMVQDFMAELQRERLRQGMSFGG